MPSPNVDVNSCVSYRASAMLSQLKEPMQLFFKRRLGGSMSKNKTKVSYSTHTLLRQSKFYTFIPIDLICNQYILYYCTFILVLNICEIVVWLLNYRHSFNSRLTCTNNLTSKRKISPDVTLF